MKQRITIRLTDDEVKIVTALCKKWGKKISATVRKCINIAGGK